LNIYGLAPIDGGCHWYRIREPLRGLAGIGHTVNWGELFDESVVTRHDTILTHLLHGDVQTEAWRLLAEAGQHRLVYDLDDDVWAYAEHEPGTEQAEYWNRERVGQVEECIGLSGLVTTPSEVLARKISLDLALTDNVAVLPNTVPAWLLEVPRMPPARFTLGYQGASGGGLHKGDMLEFGTELLRVLSRCPEAELHFLGQQETVLELPPGVASSEVEGIRARLKHTPWTPDIPAYYRSLAAGVTVGVGPLRRNPFTAAKSSIRAVEYAALGIPAVLSDVEPYRGWVDHGRTGYLIHEVDRREWRRQLIKLYRLPDLVEKMSRAARARAAGWTTEANARRVERAYQTCRVGEAVAA
jgi:hypothetical protein